MHHSEFLYIMQIGNPTINFEAERPGSFEFCSTHALASDRDVAGVLKYCNFSLPNEKFSDACKKAWMAVAPDTVGIENLNILISPGIDCMHVNLTVPPKKVSVSDNFSFKVIKIFRRIDRKYIYRSYTKGSRLSLKCVVLL